MRTIYLISCTKTKQKVPYKLPARELYSSEWFKAALAYSEKQNHDDIYVISAKHHLVTLDMELDYYDVNLNDFSEKENQIWADKVIEGLSKLADLDNDKFIIFAIDDAYRKNLITRMKNYEIPLGDLSREAQIKWFGEH